jgi:prolipoprotein diacylglyceryltransferase
VGEHFGSHSTWFGAVEFRGGTTREPAQIGQTFHNTAIYELVYLLVLFAILTLLIRRRPAPGTVMGIFCLYYGAARFMSDFLRVNDKTVWPGLTGAQYLMILVFLAGIWITTSVRKKTSAEELMVPVPAVPEPSDGEPLESTS